MKGGCAFTRPLSAPKLQALFRKGPMAATRPAPCGVNMDSKRAPLLISEDPPILHQPSGRTTSLQGDGQTITGQGRRSTAHCPSKGHPTPVGRGPTIDLREFSDSHLLHHGLYSLTLMPFHLASSSNHISGECHGYLFSISPFFSGTFCSPSVGRLPEWRGRRPSS